MTQAEPTLTTLGPNAQILDQNLFKEIRKATALSPTTLLKIANLYRGGPNAALADQLILIALKIASKYRLPKTSSPTSSPTEQPTPFTTPAASTAVPMDEWSDELEDFWWGYIDAEDKSEIAHPGVSSTENVYWLPFSTSLPNIGLLIVASGISTSVILPDQESYFIIGFSSDPNNLQTIQPNRMT